MVREVLLYHISHFLLYSRLGFISFLAFILLPGTQKIFNVWRLFLFLFSLVVYMIVKKREGEHDAAKRLCNTFSSKNIVKYKTFKQ